MEELPLPAWGWHCYCTSEVGKLSLRVAVRPHGRGEAGKAAQGCLSTQLPRFLLGTQP